MKKLSLTKFKKYLQMGLIVLVALLILKVLIFNAVDIIILLFLLAILFYVLYKSS